MNKKRCPKCSSTNTEYILVTEHKTKRARRSLIMWILFWWWFEILLWFFLTIPRLLIAIFLPKKTKTTSQTHSVLFCKNCGYQER